MRVQREGRESSFTSRHQPGEREPDNAYGRHTRGMVRTPASLGKASAMTKEADAKSRSRRALPSHDHVHSRDTRMPPASSEFESDYMHTARGAESDTMITARDMHTSRTDDYMSAVEPNTCRSTNTLEDGDLASPSSAPAYGLPAYQFDGRTALMISEQSSRSRYGGGGRGHGRGGQPSYEGPPAGTKQTFDGLFGSDQRISRNSSTAKSLGGRSKRFDKPSSTRGEQKLSEWGQVGAAGRTSVGGGDTSPPGGFRQSIVEDVFSYARHNRVLDLERMMDQGVPVDVRDSHGNTSLIVACQNGHKRALKAALRHGADPDASNARGNTALHYCYAFGYGSTLGRYLMDKGADSSIRNRNGLV
ncbi:unnamed protein product, partial [Ectocarpus fasciculatus]